MIELLGNSGDFIGGVAVWEQTKTSYPELFRNHVDGELIPQAAAVKASMDQFLVGPQP